MNKNVYMFRYIYTYKYTHTHIQYIPIETWNTDVFRKCWSHPRRPWRLSLPWPKKRKTLGSTAVLPKQYRIWWFQSVRAGYPLLGLFLPVEHVFLSKTPREMGKTYRHIIWDLRETWLRSGMYFSSPNCQNIFKKTLTTRSGSLVELFLGGYPT